jgi:hypothetical protein
MGLTCAIRTATNFTLFRAAIERVARGAIGVLNVTLVPISAGACAGHSVRASCQYQWLGAPSNGEACRASQGGTLSGEVR